MQVHRDETKSLQEGLTASKYQFLFFSFVWKVTKYSNIVTKLATVEWQFTARDLVMSVSLYHGRAEEDSRETVFQSFSGEDQILM